MKYNLAIIIPTYNEENRIARTLESLCEYIKSIDLSYIIIISDDGSKDKTCEIAENIFKSNSKIFKKSNYEIIRSKQNKGKGFALRNGIESVIANYYYLADSDLSSNWNVIDKFLKEIKRTDIVIGSRAVSGAVVETSIYRRFFGRLSALIIKLTFGLSLKDTQCGYKLINKKSSKIFLKTFTNRWATDFEFLFLASCNNLKIKEIGIHWVNQAGSKVKFYSYIRTLFDLIRIRFNNYS